MAINSHTKRRAATALPWHVILPVPNNSIDMFDRWHIAGYYHIISRPIFVRLYDEHLTQPRTFDKPTTHPRTHDY